MRRVNSIFKLLWAFAMLALPSPLVVSATLAQGGPPAPPVSPATVTFRDDLTGDRIRSDGLGPYTDGGGNNGRINCFLRSYEKNQNLILGLSNSGTGRTLILDYTQILQPPNAPSGIWQGSGAVVVNNIASMPVTNPPSARITTAQFNTGVGFFNWTGMTPSTWVYVVRTSQQTWTISTEGPVAGAGDVSVLSSSNKRAVLGYYHMPFGVSVDCPTCPVCGANCGP